MLQRGAITLIALCTLAACSQADASGDAEKQSKPKVTTTTAPSTTTTTTPPPYSFDGSVPAPELINTGTDYEAIYRSLERIRATGSLRTIRIRALLPEAYVEGTPVFDGYIE